MGGTGWKERKGDGRDEREKREGKGMGAKTSWRSTLNFLPPPLFITITQKYPYYTNYESLVLRMQQSGHY